MSFFRSAQQLSRILIVPQILSKIPQAESRRFAGHSHWQNVRHIKAAKDANKATQTDKHVRIIATAVTSGGGPDPRLNKILAAAIEGAKRTQVVTTTAIENAIKRAVSGVKGKTTKAFIYEFVGEHGVLVLASCEVYHASKFIHVLKQILKRHEFGMPKGGVKERFEEKGFVCVSGKLDDTEVDPDEALAVALEGGAEDVTEIGEEKDKIFEFICSSQDYFVMLKVLQMAGYRISDTGIKYVPMIPISIEDDDILEKVSNFCDELEAQAETVSVHTNIA